MLDCKHLLEIKKGSKTMKFRNLTLAALFEVVTSIAILVLSLAQTNSTLSSHSASRYTPYEKLVYKIALTFHEHFDAPAFEQNKPAEPSFEEPMSL
jgi:hypothetical protein